MNVVYPNFSFAWVDQLHYLAALTKNASPRGMATREATFTHLEVMRPLTIPLAVAGRELKNVIGVLEGLSLVGQVSVSEMFTDRIRKFHDFTDDGVFHGAYGARAHGQIGDVIRTLQRDPDSRQAALTIFDATRDLDRPKKDIPCTLSIQFLLRHGELDAGVTMRSNDAWLGMPYDFVQFAILQASVAQALGVAPGMYTHSVGSLHLYERDLEAASEVDYDVSKVTTMKFPLWNAVDLSEIVHRARAILLGMPQAGMTPFESWAWALLHA